MLTRKHYDSLTEDKDKAGSKKVNKSGDVQKVTITTNNRIRTGFTSAQRKKAKHWTQNQLTNRMHINYQKIQTSLEMLKTFYSTSD